VTGVRILWVLLAGAALCAAPPQAAPAVEPAAEERVALPPLEQLQVDAVSYVEAQAAALSGKFVFHVVKPPVLQRIPPGAKLTFEPLHVSRKELGGMFFVTFRQKLDGRPLGLIRVDMEGTWTGRLLRVKAPLARKAIPEADQFEPMDFEGNPPAGALTELPAGYRLRAAVSTGHILAMQDLEVIPVISPGEQVRLEVVSGPLVIAVEALARSGGAVGDKVRLEMPTSHRNVQAVATGPGEARVQWAGGN
jgi:hypothetical protein